MSNPIDLFRAALNAGWAVLRPVKKGQMSRQGSHAPTVNVPIRSLGANQRTRIATHLLSLSAHDRYLRFGYAVQDEQIRVYVDGLQFDQDEIFGIFDRKLALLAVAHLAYGQVSEVDTCAEFGVSVLERARGRGYGKRLFDRAAMHAANHGVQTMFIHALSENVAMLNIARASGARVKREGAESDAYLQLQKASVHSRIAEHLAQQIANADYRFKRRARQFRYLFASPHGVRQGSGDTQKKRPH